MKQIATQETVYAAAEALLAAGREPSTTLVQEQTGGSYTTVKRFLDIWAADRKARIEAVEIPAEIAARGQAFVQGLYSHAVQAAKAANAEPLMRAREAMRNAEERLAAAEAEVARLEILEQDQASQLETYARRVQRLETGMAALQAVVAEKTASIARLEEQLAEATRSLTAREQEIAGAKGASDAVSALQGQLETLQKTVHVLASRQDG